MKIPTLEIEVSGSLKTHVFLRSQPANPPSSLPTAPVIIAAGSMGYCIFGGNAVNVTSLKLVFDTTSKQWLKFYGSIDQQEAPGSKHREEQKKRHCQHQVRVLDLYCSLSGAFFSWTNSRCWRRKLTIYHHMLSPHVVAAISCIMKYTSENPDFHKVKQTVNKRNPAQPGKFGPVYNPWNSML